MSTRNVRSYKVIVTEHFVTRFTIQAESEEAAIEEAEELAVNLSFHGTELLECTRTTEVEK